MNNHVLSTAMPEGNSFLPRIESVFYAVFDIRQGAKIVYQVPEGLIAVSSAATSSTNGGSSIPPTPTSDTLPFPLPSISSSGGSGLASRNSSSSLVSPTDPLRQSRGRNLGSSPQKRSTSSQRTLFNFNDISMYVIPPSPLCGRLVTCATHRYRIIGHPVALKGGRYKRNYFRYNLCFVFDHEADLSCYEPIVRKVSHVFKACEVRLSCTKFTISFSYFHRKSPNFCHLQSLLLQFMPFWNSFMKI